MQTVLTHSNGIHYAASNGIPAKLATLLKRRGHLVNEVDRLGHTPLAYAVLNEDVESIKVLLEYVLRAVWFACCYSRLVNVVTRTFYLLPDVLCSYQADINVQGGDGNSPLHIACAQGNTAIFNAVISLTTQDVNTTHQNCEGLCLCLQLAIAALR